MKKIYTLALMALAGIASANAQAFKLDKNYVLTTSMKVADGTTVSPGFAGNEIGGGDIAKISEAFLDEDYSTLPISGGTAEGTNYHILKNNYTDAETGISFKAGTYACLNSNTELKFKDSYYPQGLSNIKKVIFYLASQGQLQAYARQYTGESVDNDYCHFEGDPTNRKLNPYYAPGFEASATWTEMSFNKPLKLVIDLTNNQSGTAEEISAGTVKMTMGGDTELVNMLYQFYEKAEGPDGGIIQGEKLIPWTADSKFVVAFKKKAYVMAIALISGTDGAASKYIDIAAENPQWTDTHSTTSTGINGVYSYNGTDKTVKAVYSANGVQINGMQKGVNIVKYSDGTSVKVIK